MQTAANILTVVSRLLGHSRTALGASAARRNAPESFALYVPGRGPAGDYATFEQAEMARFRLSYSQRQRAIICDADGHTLYR